MNCSKGKVKVVIPVYTETLSGRAEKSFRQTMKVLANHPITLLVPEDLNAGWFQREYPNMEITRVSADWLGSKGIAGYNRMMLSREFYEIFNDYDYILICQTDVWIFRDELEQWCDAGYDYVAAPWPKREVYDKPLIRHWLKFRRRFFLSDKRILRQQGFNKVGNGGLSLRRIEAFINVCDKQADIIERDSKRSEEYSTTRIGSGASCLRISTTRRSMRHWAFRSMYARRCVTICRVANSHSDVTDGTRNAT